ncbi:hypothetical protein [Helicobacter marmotae]|nr:hypothetical protein [Helicobacter marmotae]
MILAEILRSLRSLRMTTGWNLLEIRVEILRSHFVLPQNDK